MVSRSELVDVRPFRTGLIVVSLGLLLALGADHGGLVGRALEGIVGTLLGATGATIVGVTTLVVGALLLSGASAGALLRGSGRAVRSAARNRPQRTTTTIPVRHRSRPPSSRHEPPVDVLHDYPDVVGEAPLLVHDLQEAQTRARTSPRSSRTRSSRTATTSCRIERCCAARRPPSCPRRPTPGSPTRSS